MAKNNYYAVRVGSETGVFKSWEETEPHVNGVSGAEYKGFTNRAAAVNYLKDKPAVQIQTKSKPDLENVIDLYNRLNKKQKRIFQLRTDLEPKA